MSFASPKAATAICFSYDEVAIDPRAVAVGQDLVENVQRIRIRMSVIR